MEEHRPKKPFADREWGWQYLFPASSTCQDPRSGLTRRHHLHESSLQKAGKEAARSRGLTWRHMVPANVSRWVT